MSGNDSRGGGAQGSHGRRRLPLGHIRAILSRAQANTWVGTMLLLLLLRMPLVALLLLLLHVAFDLLACLWIMLSKHLVHQAMGILTHVCLLCAACRRCAPCMAWHLQC